MAQYFYVDQDAAEKRLRQIEAGAEHLELAGVKNAWGLFVWRGPDEGFSP
ncbi:MAG: hypothetical protein M5R36_23715 [Deltaproteobacteria bacterium]|nr:hypothetical protein [Deltaproteobacteria bacterium]